MTTVWNATVESIGGEAADMIEAGLLILFASPVPDALADVSVIHDMKAAPLHPIAANDRIVIGEESWTITEVGERANDNLTELGHIVLYANQPDQELLPGAMKIEGGDLVIPTVGSSVSFVQE